MTINFKMCTSRLTRLTKHLHARRILQKTSSENLKGRQHLGNIRVDVRAILKRILETYGVRYELGTIGSIRSSNLRRHGNEPSGSLKTRIFILSQKRLGNYQLLKKHTVANGSKAQMKKHVHYEARKDRNGDGVGFQG